MDNYDLSDLPLLGHCADAEEYHPWFTDEENRRATFSRRSTTVTTSEQTELQREPLTDDEQIPEQRALADFDISLASAISAAITVDVLEDPFASLAAFQPLTIADESQHPSGSELALGLSPFEGFKAEDLTDVLLAEPEGNDILELSMQLEPREQPVQSQGESDAKGIVIPESANPYADSDKRSGKWRAFKQGNVVIGDLPESVIKESSRRFDIPTGKRKKLDSLKTKRSLLPSGMTTRSQYDVTFVKSTSSQNNTGQSPDESLRAWVEKETNQWVVLRKGEKNQFACGYPGCDYTSNKRHNLRTHIFSHTGISLHKCTYPECGEKPYFRTKFHLKSHMQSVHKKRRPYQCILCGKRFGHKYYYIRHSRQIHKISP